METAALPAASEGIRASDAIERAQTNIQIHENPGSGLTSNNVHGKP
jgi:hypothetical protein